MKDLRLGKPKSEAGVDRIAQEYETLGVQKRRVRWIGGCGFEGAGWLL
jgi:hypothetical protein